MSKPRKDEQPSDVGERFSLTIERHASKPLWRLRERSVFKGKQFERSTDWRTFPDFSPEMLTSQGRLKSFLFSDLGGRTPVANRSGS